ncbi:MAG: hypothetical protein WDZ59_05130 [Pirellulales bacterium]
MADSRTDGSQSTQRPDRNRGTQSDSERFGEKAKQQANRGRAAASEAAEQAREKGAQAGKKAADTMREAGERVQQGAAEAADNLRRKGEDVADDQKAWAADELSHASQAVRRAADHWHEENDHRIAEYAESAADRLEDLSNYLGRSDWRRLLHDAQDLGRRRPDLFLGGMFVAGLGIARFLKSTGGPSTDRHDTLAHHEDQPHSSSLS